MQQALMTAADGNPLVGNGADGGAVCLQQLELIFVVVQNAVFPELGKLGLSLSGGRRRRRKYSAAGLKQQTVFQKPHIVSSL